MSGLLALDPTTGTVVMDVAPGFIVTCRGDNVRYVAPIHINELLKETSNHTLEIIYGGDIVREYTSFNMSDPLVFHWVSELANGNSIPLAVTRDSYGNLVPSPGQERKIGFLRAMRQVVGTLSEGGHDKAGLEWVHFRYHPEIMSVSYFGNMLVPWYGQAVREYAFFLHAQGPFNPAHVPFDAKEVERALRSGEEVVLPARGHELALSAEWLDLFRRVAPPGTTFLRCRTVYPKCENARVLIRL